MTERFFAFNQKGKKKNHLIPRVLLNNPSELFSKVLLVASELPNPTEFYRIPLQFFSGNVSLYFPRANHDPPPFPYRNLRQRGIVQMHS